MFSVFWASAAALTALLCVWARVCVSERERCLCAALCVHVCLRTEALQQARVLGRAATQTARVHVCVLVSERESEGQRAENAENEGKAEITGPVRVRALVFVAAVIVHVQLKAPSITVVCVAEIAQQDQLLWLH